MNRDKQLISNAAILFAALLTALAGGVNAGDYSNVYFFGDSLSDDGAYAPLIGPNARFTTNPGTVWTDNLGASYGKAVGSAYAAWQVGDATSTGGFAPIVSGNNFAVGGARVNADPGNISEYPGLGPFIPSVSTQVTDFLARGAVDPDALYAILAGSNDIFSQATSVGAGGSLEAAYAGVVAAAQDFVAQVDRLQAAGVRNLIVIGVPDIGKTPAAAFSGTEALLSSLTATYDATQSAGLAGKNLLYFDGNKLFTDIFADPTAYGFTNTTTPACPGNPPAALGCQAGADGHMFADAVHWTTSLHNVVSDWIYSSLQAGSRAALFSLLPIRRSGTQWLAIDNRLQAFQNFGYKGQGFFVSGDYANASINSAAGLPSGNSSGGGFVLGYEKALTEQLFSGVTLGYGYKPFDFEKNQGSLNYDEWALSAFASHKFGAFYSNVLASYSWLDFESERSIALGQRFKSSERGDTSGDQFGVKGQIGYNFVVGGISHGPIVGLTWERVTVNGFNEKSWSATAMSFGDQVRESLRSRFGWQAASEIHWSGAKIRPFVQLTYDFEHLKDARSYRIGFVGGTSGMDMYTANRTGGYGTLLVGVNTELSETIRLGINGSTTISQPGADNAAVNAMLAVSF